MSETLYLAPPIVFEAGPVMQQVTEKLSLQLLKKISEARRAIDRRAKVYQRVRWSEAIERNEAYESFSAAC